MINHEGVLHYALRSLGARNDFYMLCCIAVRPAQIWSYKKLVRRPYVTCLQCLYEENRRGKPIAEYDEDEWR